MENKGRHEEHHDSGKSSFDLINSAKLFDELKLKKGSTLLDAGCGRGQYSIAASKILGDNGLVYAIDQWKEGISELQEKISSEKINNIKAMTGDISKQIPLKKRSVNVCLMAAVFHGLVQNKAIDGALSKIADLLTTDASLEIIEFIKSEDSGSPGPPINIRLTPEEVEGIVVPYGFKKERVVEIGPYNYLITFTPN